MRKRISVFFNFVLVNATLINIVACQWGCISYDYDWADKNEQDISGDYIVPDINKRTEKIKSDRLDLFGNDVASLKKWYLKSTENWFNKTNKKLKFINNLEEKIQYKAKKEAIDAFNLLANNKKHFINFYDLQKQLNNINLGKINVNVNWAALIKSLAITAYEKDEIEKQLLRFYNILAQLYDKKNMLKLLYRMAEINQDNLLGFIESRFIWDAKLQNYSVVQVMAINPISLNKKTQYWQYHTGQKASAKITRTIVHEYGHALGTFICLNLEQRESINSLADNNPNEWWNNYFKTSYLLKNNVSKINNETNYMISSLAKGTKINNAIYQKLLAYAIVRSNYGRSSHADLFAEAFDQWINTEENQRNIAWEKLDKFFRIDLPKVLEPV